MDHRLPKTSPGWSQRAEIRHQLATSPSSGPNFIKDKEIENPNSSPPFPISNPTSPSRSQSLLASSSNSPPSSPKVPVIKSMRPSGTRIKSGSVPRNTTTKMDSDDDESIPLGHKARMIRGKWFWARFRTVLYMVNWATAATVFGLVTYVWADDYLPFKETVSTDRIYFAGKWPEVSTENLVSGMKGMRIRAWPQDLDLRGVYLILAFCGTGSLVFFALWVLNIYQSARSYYVQFTFVEYITLGLLCFYTLAFGATAAYVTHVFKVDKRDRDFWGWTCSRQGTAQEEIFKGQIHYDGDCEILTASWYTLLVLFASAFLSLLTFPANMLYNNRVKNTGFSRFEGRIMVAADQEERLTRRKFPRSKEEWNLPRWKHHTEV